MYTKTKHDITNIPFQLIEENFAETPELSEEFIAEFAKTYRLKEAWTWLGPQIVAHLATYRLPAKTDISARQFLDMNVRDKPREMGLWRFLTKVPRSKVMSTQTNKQNLPYCALVPMYMRAQKEFNDIPYKNWVQSEVPHLVDAMLARAITYKIPEGTLDRLTPAQLVEIRTLGLSNNGKPRNPATYHRLLGIDHTPLVGVPVYLQAMLTQIWVAHPSNRHKYMILSCSDWDSMPDPLVSSEPIKKTYTYNEPW